MKHWAEALLSVVVLGVLAWAFLLYGGESNPGSGGNEPPPVVVDPDAAIRGEVVASGQGCFLCHSVDGTGGGTGPTFKGLAGSQRPLTTGEFVRADEAYLRRSILDPSAEIVEGYQDVMPGYFAEELSEEELDDLIAFINSLGS